MRRLPSRLLRTLVGLAFAASAAPSLAAAQAATLPIAPGTRVRVSANNLVAPLVSNYVQTKGDTALFMESGGRGIWSIPLADITRIERSDGERNSNTPYIVRGAIIGAIPGAVAGIAVASSLSPDEGKKYSRVLSGAVGATVGGVIGGVIGSRLNTERWTNVPLPRRLAIVPSRDRLSLSVGFGF